MIRKESVRTPWQVIEANRVRKNGVCCIMLHRGIRSTSINFLSQQSEEPSLDSKEHKLSASWRAMSYQSPIASTNKAGYSLLLEEYHTAALQGAILRSLSS
uniref:Uncharacterized protein n=1 Tax=Opuntia streptacantha TaxID=393608 RepID=A0A7C9D5D0_OPUST